MSEPGRVVRVDNLANTAEHETIAHIAIVFRVEEGGEQQAKNDDTINIIDHRHPKMQRGNRSER